MKPLEKLCGIERQIRGWMPTKPVTTNFRSKRRTRAMGGIAITAVVAFFFFAPVVYSPTEVYVGVSAVVGSGCVQEGTPTCSQPTATYSGWKSLSCLAFGHGMFYGLDYGSNSYLLRCYPPPLWPVPQEP